MCNNVSSTQQHAKGIIMKNKIREQKKKEENIKQRIYWNCIEIFGNIRWHHIRYVSIVHIVDVSIVRCSVFSIQWMKFAWKSTEIVFVQAIVGIVVL